MTGTTQLVLDHSSETSSILCLAVGADYELRASALHVTCASLGLDAGFTLAVIAGFQY